MPEPDVVAGATDVTVNCVEDVTVTSYKPGIEVPAKNINRTSLPVDNLDFL